MHSKTTFVTVNLKNVYRNVWSSCVIQKQRLLLLIPKYWAEIRDFAKYSKTTFVTVNHNIIHKRFSIFNIQKQRLLLLIYASKTSMVGALWIQKQRLLLLI